jgi:hypothetical protein
MFNAPKQQLRKNDPNYPARFAGIVSRLLVSNNLMLSCYADLWTRRIPGLNKIITGICFMQQHPGECLRGGKHRAAQRQVESETTHHFEPGNSRLTLNQWVEC